MENYLEHHGILGMKWGVRRYQNKDGSLTSAGKKRLGIVGRHKQKRDYIENASAEERYGKNSQLSKRRRTLEKRYLVDNPKMSQAKAIQKAENRIKTEKVLAIAGGVAAAAVIGVASYGIYQYAKDKHLNLNKDITLPKGTVFQNIGSFNTPSNHNGTKHLYTTFRNDDMSFFKYRFGSSHAWKHELTAMDEIRIPSEKKRFNTFEVLYKTNPDFKRALERNSGHVSLTAKQAYKNMWQKFGNRNDEAWNKARQQYFDVLKSQGFNAIIDENDTNPRVFRSNAPLILLDQTSKAFSIKSNQLTGKEMAIARKNAQGFERVSRLLNAIGAKHTNHLFESNATKQRFAERSKKYEKYLDTYLDAGRKANKILGAKSSTNDELLKKMASQGSTYNLNRSIQMGKLMSEKGMSWDKAWKVSRITEGSKEAGKTAALVTLATASALAPTYGTVAALGGASYVFDKKSTRYRTVQRRKSIINNYKKQGLTNKEIAKKMKISESSIYAYLNS